MSEDSRLSKLLRGLRRSKAPAVESDLPAEPMPAPDAESTPPPTADERHDSAPMLVAPAEAVDALRDLDPVSSPGSSPGSGIDRALETLMSIEGSKCVALVDSSSGMILGHAGSGIDIEVAAAGNTQVLRAKVATLRSLGLADSISDILITLTSEYHLIRPLPENPTLFYYLVLDAGRANPAMARFKAADADLVLNL